MNKIKFNISFCIVCMNRLHQLQQTLLQNITDNAGYEGLEFILLDYNSQDGMESWVQQHMGGHIASGRLTYYRTYDPVVFCHSHSKNMAFKLAGGDIVCNINADNYTGPGFAHYINNSFSNNNNIVLTPIDFYKTTKGYHPTKDVFGRVCVQKNSFLSVNGFDERMVNYGFEDFDFINRLEMLDVKRTFIRDFSFLQYIHHEDEERFSTQQLTGNTHAIYIHYVKPCTSELLFLYNDNRFEMGAVQDNTVINAGNYKYAYTTRKYLFEFSRKNRHWCYGTWQEADTENSLTLSTENGKKISLKKNSATAGTVLTSTSNHITWYPVNNAKNIETVTNWNYILASRVIMEQNLQQQRMFVNPDGFGKGVVYKNFDTSIKIPV